MRSGNQGFTLIELLIVIAIIGILAAVLIPNLLNARKRANDTANASFARQVVSWIAAADLAATDATKQTALKGVATCIGANTTPLGAEGAPVGLPNSVQSCAVAYVPATGRYTVTATSTNNTVATAVY